MGRRGGVQVLGRRLRRAVGRSRGGRHRHPGARQPQLRAGRPGAAAERPARRRGRRAADRRRPARRPTPGRRRRLGRPHRQPHRCRDASTGRDTGRARTSPRRATCSTVRRSSTRWPRRTTRPRRTSDGDCCAASRPALAAGGDRRGLESAALSIWKEGASYGGGLDIGTDLRVDDHVDARRRARPAARPALPLLRASRSRHAAPDRGRARRRGHRCARRPSATPRPTYGRLDAAFAQWSGVNNYEERTQPGQLDPIVWDILQQQASAAR